MISNKYARLSNPVRLNEEELSEKIQECEQAINQTEAEVKKYGRRVSIAKKLLSGSILVSFGLAIYSAILVAKREVYAPASIKEFYTLRNEEEELQRGMSELEKKSMNFILSGTISLNALERVYSLQRESENIQSNIMQVLKDRLKEVSSTQKNLYESSQEIRSYVDKTNNIKKIPSPPWNYLLILGIIGTGVSMLRNDKKRMKAEFEKENLEFQLPRLEEALKAKQKKEHNNL